MTQDPGRLAITETVQVEEALEHDVRNRRVRVKTITQRELSWKIFRTVAILAGGLAAFVAIFAVLTYPSLGDIKHAFPKSTDAERLDAWQKARADWAQQFTLVSQTVLFGSVIPLLATIAGYAIGERRGETENTGP